MASRLFSHPYSGRFRPLFVALPIVVTLFATALHYTRHWSFTFDDAAISFTFARNWARGFGLGMFDPRGQVVEGYSNFLWVFVLAIGVKLGASALLTAKVAGLIFSLGTVLLLHLILLRLGARLWILWGVLLLPLSFSWTIWSVSGLENSLLGFLVLLSVYLALSEDVRPETLPWASAVAVSLTAMTRPDAMVYLGPVVAFKVLQVPFNRSQLRVRLRSLVVWSGVVLLVLGSYELWHFWYFRYPLPNTVYAKARGLTPAVALDLLTNFESGGWRYVIGFLNQNGADVLLPPLGMGVIICFLDRARLLPLMAASALLLPILTPYWTPYFRFMYAFIPLGVLVTLLGVERMVAYALRRPKSPLRIALAVAAGVLVARGGRRFVEANVGLSADALAAEYSGIITMKGTTASMQRLLEATNELGLDDPLCAMPDVGGPSYELQLRILDLAKLADVHIAHNDYERRFLEHYLYRERLPEVIHTHSVWTDWSGILGMDSMPCQYIPFMWNRSNNHAVLVRRDLVIGPSPETETSVSLSYGLELIGLVGPSAVRTDVKAVAVDLYWKAGKPIPSRLGLIVRLIDETGREVDKRTVPVGYHWYKTNEWQSGEVVRQRFALRRVPRRGLYQLELRVSDETGAGESSDPAIWPIRIDNPAASRFVADQKTLAELALKNGAFEEALRRISVARSAQPEDQSLVDTAKSYRRLAEVALRGVAQAQMIVGDVNATLTTIRRAETFRRPPIQSKEWRNLSKELLRRSSLPQKTVEETYNLAWSAVLADPSYGAAVRRLEEARRSFLAASNLPVSQVVCNRSVLH